MFQISSFWIVEIEFPTIFWGKCYIAFWKCQSVHNSKDFQELKATDPLISSESIVKYSIHTVLFYVLISHNNEKSFSFCIIKEIVKRSYIHNIYNFSRYLRNQYGGNVSASYLLHPVFQCLKVLPELAMPFKQLEMAMASGKLPPGMM